MLSFIIGICFTVIIVGFAMPALGDSLSSTRPDGQWAHAVQLYEADGCDEYELWGRNLVMVSCWPTMNLNPTQLPTHFVTVTPTVTLNQTTRSTNTKLPKRDAKGRFVKSTTASAKKPSRRSRVNLCDGHPAGPFDPMGQTVYCDGSCRPVVHDKFDLSSAN